MFCIFIFSPCTKKRVWTADNTHTQAVCVSFEITCKVPEEDGWWFIRKERSFFLALCFLLPRTFIAMFYLKAFFLSIPPRNSTVISRIFVRGEVQKRLSTHDWLMSLYLKRCVHFYTFFLLISIIFWVLTDGFTLDSFCVLVISLTTDTPSAKTQAVSSDAIRCPLARIPQVASHL